MQITKFNWMKGKHITKDLPITEEQLKRWKEDREHIQNVMPHLSEDDREFLISGLEPDDWEKLFPDGET